MKPQIIIPMACILVGSLAGFMLGRGGSADSDQGAASAATSMQPRSSERSLGNNASEARVKKGKRVKSVREALSMDTETGKTMALIAYFEGLDASDFAEEAKKLEGLPAFDRMRVGLLLFSQWGEIDPTTAVTYNSKDSLINGFMNAAVLKSWASSDPEEVAAYLDSEKEGRGGEFITVEWMKKDQNAALAWALDKSEQGRSGALKSMFHEMASVDPEKAVSLLGSISDDASRISAQNAIAEQWGRTDWAATEAWVLTLPEDQQDKTVNFVLRGLVETDHVAAAERFAALANVEGLDKTMALITRKWSDDDPAAATAWVLENGTTKAQKENIAVTMHYWARSDKAAAYDFLNKQEVGEVRDRATHAYIKANHAGDTNENLDLAEAITDTATRASAIQIAVIDWLKADKEAAAAYINASTFLTDRQKKRSLK